MESTKQYGKALSTTAAKKTWGGQWFPQVFGYVATFVVNGQAGTSKATRFLAGSLAKMPSARNKSHYVLPLMLFSLTSTQYDCTFVAFGTIR